MTPSETEAAVTEVCEDEQGAALIQQIIALVAELNRRAHVLSGLQIPAETLLRCVLRGLQRASDRAVKDAAAGPVVSISAMRAAKTPPTVNYFTLTLEAPTLEAVDALAARSHGEANTAARSLVLRTALERGLQLMLGDRL